MEVSSSDKPGERINNGIYSSDGMALLTCQLL
jgi:hypothetical protein